MKELLQIVEEAEGRDCIVTSGVYEVKDTWLGKLLGLPVSYRKQFYQQPLEVIETDKVVYIDRRPSYINGSYRLIAPSLLMGTGLIFFNYTSLGGFTCRL